MVKSIAAKDRKLLLKRILGCWQLYLLLVIPIAYVITFHYIPMAGIQLAFKNFDMRLGIWGSKWIGFEHFIKFVNSYQFSRIFTNTVKISLYSLIAGFPVPLIFALLLNAIPSARFKKSVQTITYMPHFISTVVIVGMLLQVFNPRIGAFGLIYSALLGTEAPNLFSNADSFSHMYVWSGIWQHMGWNSIIYMAALSSVDQELHESAIIDGAGRFKRVIYIDFPCVLPTVAILLIMNVGSIMNVGFEKIFLMQNNLNLRASEVISTYVYKVGIGGSSLDFGYATAIGLFNSVINLVLLVLVNKISKKISEHSLW